MEELHWSALDYHTCSPDLSLRDFHLFGPNRKDLGGKQFSITMRCLSLQTTVFMSRPLPSRRKLIMAITHAVLVCGCEIWADEIKKENYRRLQCNKEEPLERRALTEPCQSLWFC